MTFSFQVFYLITKKYVDSAKGEVTRSMQKERSTQEKRWGCKVGLTTCNYLVVWQIRLHLGFQKIGSKHLSGTSNSGELNTHVHTDCICKKSIQLPTKKLIQCKTKTSILTRANNSYYQIGYYFSLFMYFRDWQKQNTSHIHSFEAITHMHMSSNSSIIFGK
jgi:hypothetical protein